MLIPFGRQGGHCKIHQVIHQSPIELGDFPLPEGIPRDHCRKGGVSDAMPFLLRDTCDPHDNYILQGVLKPPTSR